MKRTVEISSHGVHVSLAQNALRLSRQGTPLARIPLDDLGTLILGSPGITVTSAALGALSAAGGVTIVVGSDQAPEGALIPLRAHTTRGERLRAQLAGSTPLRKQLWTRIVTSKLRNQAQLLDDDVGGRRRLLHLAARVRSGDPTNHEAQGARLYWRSVFGDLSRFNGEHPFRRRQDGPWPNNYLNYGYAILRSITARALCGSGLLPELGLHHHNRYDPFPLASDVMEPYRPWVDHRCRELLAEGPRELDQGAKRALLEIQDDPVEVERATTPLQVALSRTTASLAEAFLANERGEAAAAAARHLILPTFVG